MFYMQSHTARYRRDHLLLAEEVQIALGRVAEAVEPDESILVNSQGLENDVVVIFHNLISCLRGFHTVSDDYIIFCIDAVTQVIMMLARI